jgi:hypothetical protein
LTSAGTNALLPVCSLTTGPSVLNVTAVPVARVALDAGDPVLDSELDRASGCLGRFRPSGSWALTECVSIVRGIVLTRIGCDALAISFLTSASSCS